MKLLIVDDEPLARARLRRLLEELPAAAGARIDEAGDVDTARRMLQLGGHDLLLLDIQMPGTSGLQWAAELLRARAIGAPPAVVFVTAHDAHALEAFDSAAVDYLTKPVRRERLAQALDKARALLSRADPGGDGVAVVERGALLRVPLAEVLYFRADNKYTMVRTASRQHLIDAPLSELEQRYGPRFVRAHRSALVAVDAIEQLERTAPGADVGDDGTDWVVRVRGTGETLPISRRQLPALRAALRR